MEGVKKVGIVGASLAPTAEAAQFSTDADRRKRHPYKKMKLNHSFSTPTKPPGSYI